MVVFAKSIFFQSSSATEREINWKAYRTSVETLKEILKLAFLFSLHKRINIYIPSITNRNCRYKGRK